MRILFAEDDRSLCRAEKTILENAGYSVDFVHTGEDALAYALAGDYDGIVLDWMMPAPKQKKQAAFALRSVSPAADLLRRPCRQADFTS